MTRETFENWAQKIAWASLVGIVAGGVSWAGWTTIEMNQKVDRKEVETFPYPYLQDRGHIMSTLERLASKVDTQLEMVVNNNTQAIIRLQEQMLAGQKQNERANDVLLRLEQRLFQEGSGGAK